MRTYKKGIEKVQYQRNVFAAFSFIVLMSNLLLVILVLMKRERVVIVPPAINKEFWVEGNQVSPSYLEQFGIYIGQLILNKSPESVSVQNRILLRHVTPLYAPILRKALEAEKEEMITRNINHLFFVSKVFLAPTQNQVSLEGERVVYLGAEELMREPQKYTLTFESHNGHLMLKELKKEGVES